MKNKIITISFSLLIGSMLIFSLLKPDLLISKSERRTLKQRPEFEISALLDGSYMSEYEDYLLDQMPKRDEFRAMKAWMEYNLLLKKDVNDIFYDRDHLFKLEYPYQPEMVERMVEYLEKIQALYLENNKVYYSIIPDKNYYLDELILKLDYEAMIKEMSALEMIYIDLFDVLSLEDYYKTDPHWRQENLEEVIKTLASVMGFESEDFSTYNKNYNELFYGAYHGQSTLNLSPETLVYLDHVMFKDIKVYNYETSEEMNVYDKTAFTGLDGYDVFLSGASPLIEIINPNIKDKELVIFRDSFGSSLSPLLINSYHKITVVDTRYVGYEQLGEFIDFKTQDVLFLYSSLVINNSIMLK